MNAVLPDWIRPYFEEPGGKPFLFYVMYGSFEGLQSLSGSDYRSAGVTPGFELTRYDQRRNPDTLSQFRTGYLWDELVAQNPPMATRISQSNECLILRGERDDCDNLNYLRDCVGLLTFLLDHGGITVYDPLMFKWWSTKEWRDQIFEPATSVPRHHVIILTSDEPYRGHTWFHTRGMRKFGRPELSIHNVPAKYTNAVFDLCNRFIEFQAFGGVIKHEQTITMKNLPPGMTCHHGGDMDDPDFGNVHVEIRWPNSG